MIEPPIRVSLALYDAEVDEGILPVEILLSALADQIAEQLHRDSEAAFGRDDQCRWRAFSIAPIPGFVGVEDDRAAFAHVLEHQQHPDKDAALAEWDMCSRPIAVIHRQYQTKHDN